MRRISIAFALILVVGLRVTAHDNWCGYDFTQIGALNDRSDVDSTSLIGINDQGLIIGGFSDSAPPHGFLLNGAVFKEAINIPGSRLTQPRGINTNGEIVGSTQVPTTTSVDRLAFYRDPTGNYSTFAASPSAFITHAYGINTNGLIVGFYRLSSGNTSERGFLWNGHTFQTIDAPFYTRTELLGINKFNDIVGRSIDNAGVKVYSFLLSNGVYTQVEIPGALNTYVAGINDQRQIVGSYVSADPPSQVINRGFVIEDGVVTLVDSPYPNTEQTQVHGINNRGELVGSVLFTDLRRVGFVAAPRKCAAPATNADSDK